MAFTNFLSYDAVISSVRNHTLTWCCVLLAFIGYIVLNRPRKSSRPPRKQRTPEEVEALIAKFNPEPIHTTLSKSQQRNLSNELIITKSDVTRVTVNGQENVLHASRTNYLGMSGNKRISDVAAETLKKYGVGACGPRGFYGTIDVHLFLEHRIAKFVGTAECILYSSSFCTISSAIPAFSKRGDLVICDRGVSHAAMTGVLLSRSNAHYFNHNDMADLERVLKETMPVDKKKKLVRKFVVVDGLYYNYGDICPLKEIMALKEKYHFRLILDESHSIGVLGKTGRGVCEHAGVSPHEVEIITGALGNAFGGGGGFCCGDRNVVYHQRLNGSGYIFSAAMPPFLAACAEEAIDILDADTTRLETLAKNTDLFTAHFRKRNDGASVAHFGLEVTSAPESPVVHLRLDQSVLPTNNRDEEEDILEEICQHCLKSSNVLISRAKYIDAEAFPPPPSIRVCISAAMTTSDLDEIVEALKKATDVAVKVHNK